MADLWSLVAPVVVQHYDRELRRRRMPGWRDVVLTAVVVYAVLLGAYVLTGRYLRSDPGPASYTYTDPFSGGQVRCARSAPATYVCTVERTR